jgi:hypothetical protein
MERSFQTMSCCRRFLGDLDTSFSYASPRKLVIKDFRLGLLGAALQLATVCYIVYTLVFLQVYRRASSLSISLRTNVRQEAPFYRWLNGQAPFCLGVAAPAHNSPALVAQYDVSAASYAYTGPGGGPTRFPRRRCLYLDEGDAVPLEESDRCFLLTESRVTPQTWAAEPCAAPPCAPCASSLTTTPNCAYLPLYNGSAAATLRSYIPDVEFFTIQIDHGLVAPQAGLTKTARQMRGRLLDSRGEVMDPCVAYTSLGLPCDPNVAVGLPDRTDVVPLRTLMLAAGVQSLDAASGDDPASALRQQGLVLLVELSYSNYAVGDIPPLEPGGPALGGTGLANVFAQGEVQYTYRVFTTPAAFQFQSAVRNAPAPGDDPATAAAVRFFARNYGVRVNFNAGGRVGFFDFQTLLVNLIAALGLLGASAAVLEVVAFFVCPLRGMYRALRDTDTVSITELRRAAAGNPEGLKALKAAFGGGGGGGGGGGAPALEGQPPEVVRLMRGGATPAALEMGVVNPASDAAGRVAAWK